MQLKLHPTMTVEKWGKHTFGNQILMIGNEINRAGNFIRTGDPVNIKGAYERALELTMLTIATSVKKRSINELCRFKEVLAGFWLQAPSSTENSKLQDVLIRLSGEAFCRLHPVVQ